MAAPAPFNMMDCVEPVATGGGEGSSWRMPLIAAALVIVLLVVAMYVMRDSLPKRLADKGWVLYVMEGCGACAKQDEILGPYGYQVPHYPFTGKGEYLGSAKMWPPTPVSSIKAFPTWINMKAMPPAPMVVGAQNEAQLIKMAE